jgi:carboxymethylenebutenolidase
MDMAAELPSAKPVQLGDTGKIVVQPPLSRCGQGPGLLLLRPAIYAGYQQQSTSLDPEPLQKWAEESFAVAQITLDTELSGDKAAIQNLMQEAQDGLTALPGCTQGQFGLLGNFGGKKLCNAIHNH